MADQPDVLNQVLAQRRRVAERLVHIRHVVAVTSGKGGVGKSALTANLAAALGQQGRAVGVLDADIHGPSAAAMLGARGQPVLIGPAGARPAIGVADVRVMSMDLFLSDDDCPVTWKHLGGLAADSFAWRGMLEANVLREYLSDTEWGALDFLLIDMPPGADRFETLMRFIPGLSGALVVTIPSQAARLVVRRAVQSARGNGARLLGLVENMAGLVDGEEEAPRELFSGSGGGNTASGGGSTASGGGSTAISGGHTAVGGGSTASGGGNTAVGGGSTASGGGNTAVGGGSAAGSVEVTGGGEAFAAELGLPWLGSVPFDPRLARATDNGRPFVLTGAQTLTGQAILRLAGNLEKALEP